MNNLCLLFYHIFSRSFDKKEDVNVFESLSNYLKYILLSKINKNLPVINTLFSRVCPIAYFNKLYVIIHNEKFYSSL